MGYVGAGNDFKIRLETELRTPNLDAIHQYSWLAGSSSPARPLHRQKLIGRSILITEDPNEHLVWDREQMFIKPIPGSLLDYDY